LVKLLVFVWVNLGYEIMNIIGHPVRRIYLPLENDFYFNLLQKAKSQANDAKADGNKLFGAGQYEEALSQYDMALQIAAELESAEEICSACHSNRAVCFLKLVKPFFCLDNFRLPYCLAWLLLVVVQDNHL
jgi:hypothetical protein